MRENEPDPIGAVTSIEQIDVVADDLIDALAKHAAGSVVMVSIRNADDSRVMAEFPATPDMLNDEKQLMVRFPLTALCGVDGLVDEIERMVALPDGSVATLDAEVRLA